MKIAKLILPSVLFILPAASASASDCGNLAMAFLFGFNNFYNRPGVFNNYTPPYFALHPPVYYGDRYYRPYGESPFASWPQLQANPSYAPRLGAWMSAAPAIIDNPYCPACHGGTSAAPREIISSGVPDVVSRDNPSMRSIDSRPTAGPVEFDNPYFAAEPSRLTSLPGR